MNTGVTMTLDSSINIINFIDRTDRLGANLSWYVSTILIAIKNNYKIKFIKPKNEYSYSNSIFVELLFNFIEDYNERYDGNTLVKENLIKERDDYFYKTINCLLDIKCDFVTAFKDSILTQKYKKKFNELAQNRNYTIPFNIEKTIVIHLRLDDMANNFVSYNDRKNYSMKFKNIIDNDDINYTFPGYAGQSAIKEDEITSIIERVLNIYKDYEVIIITNGKHTLPYKTIYSYDESYDLFLLCNSTVLIGSMSSFSFASILFGNHKYIYYPLWDVAVCFGLTTKYDKTDIIEIF
jgi:hypothetical protein